MPAIRTPTATLAFMYAMGPKTERQVYAWIVPHGNRFLALICLAHERPRVYINSIARGAAKKSSSLAR